MQHKKWDKTLSGQAKIRLIFIVAKRPQTTKRTNSQDPVTIQHTLPGSLHDGHTALLKHTLTYAAELHIVSISPLAGIHHDGPRSI